MFNSTTDFLLLFYFQFNPTPGHWMKVKTIVRNQDACTRERNKDIRVLPRNADPALHPMQEAREYTRALNATKLERTFAKPFLAAMAGHTDGVYCMSKDWTCLSALLSGSADGEIRLWNLANRRCTWSQRQAHAGFVRGVSFVPHRAGERFLSCGDDGMVRLWDSTESDPLVVYQGEGPFTGIDCHRHGERFVTSGRKAVAVWDMARAEPLMNFEWGADTISTARFNQAEVNVLASCGSDRSIVLYDLRSGGSPLAKMVLRMSSNALSWNPMEPHYFAVANEDYNAYCFDMRYLDKAVNVYTGHVSALLDLDYSPTGGEIVTGSYDRTLRIFNSREGTSRDVYHTRRMQRLFCVRYSMDASYVLSGSDDGNIRLWKARASAKLGVLAPRESTALEYATALKERFKELPEIKRISKHRHLPKMIKSESRTQRIQRESAKRKEQNRKRHTKPEKVKKEPTLREEAIVTVKH